MRNAMQCNAMQCNAMHRRIVIRGERTKSINSVVALLKAKASGQRTEQATLIRSFAPSRLLSCFHGNLFAKNLFQ